MARNFAELEAKMTPTALAESDQRTQQMLAELIENDLEDFPTQPESQLAAAGLSGFQFRSTRHSMATELMVQGVNPKVVSEQLGHSDVSITLRAYSHVTKGLKEQAAETASKSFLG